MLWNAPPPSAFLRIPCFQCDFFCGTHGFLLSGGFVSQTAKVERSVEYHTMQLTVVGSIECCGILIHPIDGDIDLAPHFILGDPIRGAYLYRWDLPHGFRELEELQIARGQLPATGARLLALPRHR